jgi:tripartite-type tricarboxylate transporter receptor subunit TctC
LLLTIVGLLPIAGQAANISESCEQALQSRRIVIIVPYGPGGGYDSYARVFAPLLEQLTNSRVLVRNMPGAGSVAGIRAVAAARGDEAVLGLFNPVTLIAPQQLGVPLPGPEAFNFLGSFLTDTAVIAGRQYPADLPAGQGVSVIAADTELVRLYLAITALGWKSQLIRGYSGSVDRWLALLRGDVDFVFGTTESIARSLASAPEIRPLLSLTDAPNQYFTGIPYLAGPGSRVDSLTQELPRSEREERMVIASLAVDFSLKFRTLAVSRQVDSVLRECMKEAVESIFSGGSLSEALLARNLSFDPLDGEEIRRRLNQMGQRMESNRVLIDQYLQAGP